jgi:2-keto-4-pentenoate hydratase/2-oxohepta-3-ene-1,7-dioic acid hydratase in catechol pathway
VKILRFEKAGNISFGVLDPSSGEIRETVGQPFDGIRFAGNVHRLAEVRLLAPVIPSKIVAVGLNYKNHAREMGKKIPDEPLLFLKAPSALNHPGGDVVYPRAAQRLDFEAELAVVIGRVARP